MDDKKIIELRKSQNNNSQSLPFSRNADGKLKTTSIRNIVLIIDSDENLKQLFKFNEFTGEVDVVGEFKLNLSKQGISSIEITKGQYTDAVINAVELYIETVPHYSHTVFKNGLIDQAIQNVAHMHSYNPVIDYMNECHKKWDKKQRLDKLFPTYLGAEANQVTSIITELWFMGAVAKAYNPETKFDYVLDLVGGQGVGKTTLLQKLAPLGLYTDQFNTFKNKDDFEVMKNALIVNDDEMTASNDASFEEIKKFITMQVFEYRKSYARKAERFLKKFVISRTTNEMKHLKDRSGDRRFISIMANPDKQKKHPVKDLTQDYVNQIWGEAVELFKNSEDPFNISKDVEELLQADRDKFLYKSGLEDELDTVLENDFKDKEFIPNKRLALMLFGKDDALSKNDKATKEVRYYMEHKGFDVGARRRIGNNIIRGFKRK